MAGAHIEGQAGDVVALYRREMARIAEFGGVPIRTEEEFLSRVRRAEPYSTVKMVVMRGEQRVEIPVNLGRN